MTTKTEQKTRKGIRFYHPDHLGSTTVVTDLDGEVTQNVAYIPYGEVFVEQRNGTWNTPYLFNAKELDEETGLYYYGARYLDPTNVAWLSVDPLFEKYVGMTPYGYCAGNPVKLVDADGRKFDTSELSEEQTKVYEDRMQVKRDGSELFNSLYSELEKSDIVYKIRVGETENNVPAQFDRRDNSITFSSIEETDNTMAVAEEFFHAYQHSENKGKYGEGSFNYEFEAKVFTTAVGIEYGGYEHIGGMTSFQDMIVNSEFENKETWSPLWNIDTEHFLIPYTKVANEYANYNKEHNIGNVNYKKKTNVKPYSLIKITK